MPRGQPHEELTWMKLARLYRGMSQSELAEKAGLKQAQVSRLESGTREPRLQTARKLAEALGVDVDLLFPSDDPSTARDFLSTRFEASPNGRRRKR
jgi:transcriptional regulator with XRE-family HTH domain